MHTKNHIKGGNPFKEIHVNIISFKKYVLKGVNAVWLFCTKSLIQKGNLFEVIHFSTMSIYYVTKGVYAVRLFCTKSLLKGGNSIEFYLLMII